jgi:hypothetical protein
MTENNCILTKQLNAITRWDSITDRRVARLIRQNSLIYNLNLKDIYY